MFTRIVSFAFALCVLTSAAAQDKKDQPAGADKSIAAVRTYIDSLKFGKGAGALRHMSDGPVQASFPEYHFINARFPQFPVARITPEGLHPSSVFAVNAKDYTITFLKDTKALQAFARANHAPVKGDKDARTVLAAWLIVSSEFHQDGFYAFEPADLKAEGMPFKATGRAVVMKGGNGQISATLDFDKDGKLVTATEEAKIRPGPRPICQATKLLDADPIVRRIAEQDLLIMGVAARPYLMEQRERATPELRQAIDRLWERMQKNGW